MSEELARAAARQRELDDEMVALSVASTVAYFHLTAARKQIDPGQTLSEIAPLVAAALSQVAPLYHACADGAQPARLTDREIAEAFFRKREEEQDSDLDRFTIRRGDLRTALTTLREARTLFEPRP